MAGARDQYAALLPVVEKALGPEHSDTLAIRHEFAQCIGVAGNAAGARDHFAALLPVRERVLGPDHPDTLATRNNLADWTEKAADLPCSLEGRSGPRVDLPPRPGQYRPRPGRRRPAPSGLVAEDETCGAWRSQ